MCIKYYLLPVVLTFMQCSKVAEKCRLHSNPPDQYDYPVRPGDPEWADVVGSDRLEVTQIPKRIARRMSTDGLLASYIKWPLVFELTTHHSLPKTFDFFKQNFNGVKELMTRRNLQCKVIKWYKTFDYHEMVDPVDHFGIVALLGDKEVFEPMTIDQHQELMEQCFKNYQIELEYPDYYSYATASMSLWACLRIMEFYDSGILVELMDKYPDYRTFVDNGIIFGSGPITVERAKDLEDAILLFINTLQ